MGFLHKAFERRSVSVVPESIWRGMETPVAAGVTVTNESALTFSAVFAAHKILGESVAMLPLVLLKRLPKGKERATNKSLYSVLHDVANPEMDAYLVRETMTAHLAGWGRAHAKIDYNANGEVTALWPIPPQRVQLKRDANLKIVHEVTFPDGQTKTYRSDEMLYLRGMSPDGITAYSPIRMARQGIGLALAAETYGATFFGNGATPQGVIMHPGPQAVSDTAYTHLINSWNDRHQGVSNSNKIALLEEGMKYEKIGIPPDDAQFLETRQFQIEEIARWYRIPAMMLAMSGANSTYASVESFDLQFVKYTLYPWLVRWEKGIYSQLLLERERKDYYAEHLMTAILRGDTPSRNQAYATGRQWGWYSVNDIREMENMNPINGGDVYLTPANMMDSNAPAPSTVQRSYMPVLADAIQRVVRREANDVRGAVQKIYVKRGAEAFVDWMGEFYQEHQDFIFRNLQPAVQGFAEIIAEGRELAEEDVRERVAESLRLFAIRCAGRSQEQFKNALNEADPTKAIESVIDGWDGQYVETLARMEMSKQTAVISMPAKEPEWTN